MTRGLHTLRHPVTVRKQTGSTRDASGAVVPSWTEYPSWAAVEFKATGSDERFLADQNTAITAVNFTVRVNPDLTYLAIDELIYKGRTYLVRSVLEHPYHLGYLILETEQMGENVPG